MVLVVVRDRTSTPSGSHRFGCRCGEASHQHMPRSRHDHRVAPTYYFVGSVLPCHARAVENWQVSTRTSKQRRDSGGQQRFVGNEYRLLERWYS